MGKVAISLKILPESLETDLDKLREEISKIIEIKDSKIEPIAFGLNSLKLMIITEDIGGTDELENKIKEIEGVKEVEVESVTLI